MKLKIAAGFLIGIILGIVFNILTGWPSPLSIAGFGLFGAIIVYAYLARNQL
jgi:hypothetical protein